MSRASMDRLNLLKRYQMSADIRRVAPGVSNGYLSLMMEGLLKIKAGKDAEAEFAKLMALRREPFYGMGRIPLEVLKIERRLEGLKGRGDALRRLAKEEERIGGLDKRLSAYRELIRESTGDITVAHEARTPRGLLEDANRIGAHISAARKTIADLRKGLV